MKIRQAASDDLPGIMKIYDEARAFMRQNGNSAQWNDGYPDEEHIATDIRQEHCFVCTDDDGGLVGVFSLIPGAEPTYDVIEGGQWLNELPYATVHRIAMTGRGKGAATFCLDWCFEQAGNIRIDTHCDNQPMQRLLLKNGYAYCGIIHVADGSERLAYQKTRLM
jgi:RimJ/RimL family protein N-acetyltransferase